MTIEWLLLKYIPDLHRREPLNIGVMLSTPSGRAVRFDGLSDAAKIDGRTARKFGGLVDYERWIRFWRYQFMDQMATPMDLVSQSGHMLIEYGGRLMSGAEDDNPEELADELFASLVNDRYSLNTGAEEALAHDFRRQANELIKPLRASTHFQVNVPRVLENGSSFTFPWAWVNGHTTLGYELLSAVPDRVTAAEYRVGTRPPHTEAVVLASPLLDDDDLQRIERWAHVALVGQVTSGDLQELLQAHGTDDERPRLTVPAA